MSGTRRRKIGIFLARQDHGADLTLDVRSCLPNQIIQIPCLDIPDQNQIDNARINASGLVNHQPFLILLPTNPRAR